MCGASERRVLGRRLNTPQGLRPKKRLGIATTVVRCSVCGLIYSDPLPIPQDISDHYGKQPEEYWLNHYFERKMDFFDLQLDRIKQLAPDAKTALDIGAGIGFTMQAFMRAGFDAYGIEAGEHFHRYAVEKNGIPENRIFRTMLEDANFPEGTFDCVSFGAVLEHLYDPSQALSKALGWLKPDGVIHVEVPSAKALMSKVFNLYFWLARTDYVVNISPMHRPYHLYEFTPDSFQKNGMRVGYEVARVDIDAGQTPLAPGLSRLLGPVMRATDSGEVLTVYLKKGLD